MVLVPGYLFKPLDKHLLDSYLKKKILGKPLPSDIIVEADIYTRYDMANPDGEWFFFASISQKHPGASDSCRASRSTPSGWWKATQGIKMVLNSKFNVLGSKQSFCYMERNPSDGERKTIWLMEEYSIPSLQRRAGASAINSSNKLDDWVICKIYLTPKARKINATQEDLPEIQPVNNAPPEPEAKRRRMEDPQTINSLSMHPSQDIAAIIAVDFFQIHQLADDTLPQSDTTVPVHAKMMEEGPNHVSRLANLDRSLKDIDAEDSIIAFSPEIMQTGGEETKKMAALLEREITQAGGEETKKTEEMVGREIMQAGGEETKETEEMTALLGRKIMQASGEETKETEEIAALLRSLRDDISILSIDDIFR